MIELKKLLFKDIPEENRRIPDEKCIRQAYLYRKSQEFEKQGQLLF